MGEVDLEGRRLLARFAFLFVAFSLSHASEPLRFGHRPKETTALDYWQAPLVFLIKGQMAVVDTEDPAEKLHLPL